MRTALLVLALCLGLGMGFWLVFGQNMRADHTWCGDLAGPAPAHDSEPCQVQLRRLGREIAVYKQSRGRFPATLEEFNPLPTCPWTGHSYTWDPAGRLFCPGRQHGEPNQPAFDFPSNDVVTRSAGADRAPAGEMPDSVWAAFGQGKGAFEAAQTWLKEGEYGRPAAPYVVLVAVLSARTSPDVEVQNQGKALLREAQRQLPRHWPFPLVQLLNDELVASQVHPEGEAQAAELQAWASLRAGQQAQLADALRAFQRR